MPIGGFRPGRSGWQAGGRRSTRPTVLRPSPGHRSASGRGVRGEDGPGRLPGPDPRPVGVRCRAGVRVRSSRSRRAGARWSRRSLIAARSPGCGVERGPGAGVPLSPTRRAGRRAGSAGDRARPCPSRARGDGRVLLRRARIRRRPMRWPPCRAVRGPPLLRAARDGPRHGQSAGVPARRHRWGREGTPRPARCRGDRSPRPVAFVKKEQSRDGMSERSVAADLVQVKGKARPTAWRPS